MYSGYNMSAIKHSYEVFDGKPPIANGSQCSLKKYRTELTCHDLEMKFSDISKYIHTLVASVELDEQSWKTILVLCEYIDSNKIYSCKDISYRNVVLSTKCIRNTEGNIKDRVYVEVNHEFKEQTNIPENPAEALKWAFNNMDKVFIMIVSHDEALKHLLQVEEDEYYENYNENREE